MGDELAYQTRSITDLTAIWEDIYQRFKDEIREACRLKKASLEIDLHTLQTINIDMMDLLQENPYWAICAAEAALKNILPPDENTITHIRFTNPPEWAGKQIRDLRARDLGKLVSITGLVKKVTEVRPKLQDAYFQCLKCGAVVHVPQDDFVVKEPLECYKDQGGCGRSSKFDLIIGESTFVDSQKMEIQENPEGLVGGEQPQKIAVYLEGDIVGRSYPGDIINVIGVVNGSQRWHRGGKSTEFNLVIDAHNITPTMRAFEEVKVSEKDEKEIRKAASSPGIFDSLRKSICPTIYGMDKEKDAISLMLFGGTAKDMPDGTRVRGDIHVLLVGEPGTAKTQLLKYAQRIAPRGVYTSGKGATAAGLTASAVRDDFGEGRWTLEAGALVLADQGLSVVDELDKMRAQDRDALHEAMEQQEVTIAKAGINATLKSRCALLAAANPKFGRYDDFAPIADQINLPPALISRFDLIFPIKDRIDETRDRELTRHILHAHQTAQRRARNALKSVDDNGSDNPDLEPAYDRDFLRKYIAYAKREICPVLTQAAIDAIEDFYVTIRQQGASKDSIPITARQNEGIIRLAEASARIRLSDTVDYEDAQRAIENLMGCLQEIGFDRETGTFDIDLVTTGYSKSQREKVRIITTIIRELQQASDDVTASMPSIVEEAISRGMTKEDVETYISKMLTQGQISEPRLGRYQVI